MTRRQYTNGWHKACLLGLCATILPLATVPAAAAEKTGRLPVFQADFGGSGLLQTPTARRNQVGEVSIGYSHVSPYSNVTFSFQPFSWVQAGFRYTSIGNRSYGKSISDRHYLDKGFDLKLFLTQESRYMPSVAIGLRDLGGTGLFSSEYIVANKRWHNFDFSAGLAWGYNGHRGDISNPLGLISDHFKHRDAQHSSNGGKFNAKSWFTGRAAFFGGIQYTTPWKPLTLQIEYEGNNYKHEPKNNRFEQDSPINIGARLRLGDHFTLSAAYERGNTLMLGATFAVNFATVSQPKSNPPPVIPKHSRDNRSESWQDVSEQLHDNAGINVKRISKAGDALVVDASPGKYLYLAQSELRANNILHNAAGADIRQFKYRWHTGGFVLRQDTLPRAPLPATPLLVGTDSPFADIDYRQNVHVQDATPGDAQGKTLYEAPHSGFSAQLGLGFNYNYGGPRGFLYQPFVRLSAEYNTDRHGWFSAAVGYPLFDNVSKYDYRPPTQLPRVRTDSARYMKRTHLGVYNLQYTRTARLSDNVFAMAYAGQLEQMYGGAGAELLYRSFDSPLAFGVDVNWVKKRDYDTRFGFQDYATVEGHATAYWQTGIAGIQAKLSAGRYLAKDYGVTIDLSRRFDSGIVLGAYMVRTTAGDKYGEGSFNKGIYLTIPLNILLTKSTRVHKTAAYSPLTRDGGASLRRRYSLYSLTNSRDLTGYWQGFSKHK